MARIKDVANRAGVSVASVSRVLAGLPGVGDETRVRIQAAIKDLDYRPDLAARRLRSRRADIIGLIVADIRNPFFTEISRAVEDLAHSRGLRVMFCNSDEDPDKEALYLEMMRDEKVSGVILSPTQAFLDRAAGTGTGEEFPIVLVDRGFESSGMDSVVLDNEAAAERLTQHFIDMGYRRIAFLNIEDSPNGVLRQAGYRGAMEAAGLPPRSLALPLSMEFADGPLREMLAGDALPDAILAFNGMVLLAALGALREAGIRIPQQVGLGGFDDLPWTCLVEPAITVIAQPIYRIGRTAIEILLERIAMPGAANRHVVLQGELVVRASSAQRA